MTSPERIISDNVSQLIAAAGIGAISAGGTYGAGVAAIVPLALPVSPDRAIAISVVPLTDNVTLPEGRVMVQVRVRGAQNAPYDASDMSSAIRDVLHGLSNLDWGPVQVIQMNRQLSVPNGQDSLTRQEQINQFYLDVSVPPTNTRPTAGSW
jgi:hypothetical protein